MPRRLSFRIAFLLGCFAVLMLYLGPLISGVQNVMLASEKSHALHAVFVQERTQHEQDTDAAVHEVHALMGHKINPHLPDWVNNLKMCGYCELLMLTPALLMALLIILQPVNPRPRMRKRYVAQIYASILQPHASPRSPPFLA